MIVLGNSHFVITHVIGNSGRDHPRIVKGVGDSVKATSGDPFEPHHMCFLLLSTL